MGFHAMPAAKGWSVRRSGSKRAISTNISRSKAWSEARYLARSATTTAYLHDSGGRIVVRNQYGKD